MTVARGQPKRAEQRHRTPHRGKGGGTRHQLAILTRMEARQHCRPVDRAKGIAVANIDEIDRATAVKPLDEGDLAPTQRASSVEPDRQSLHRADMGAADGAANIWRQDGDVATSD